jgi:hypothetical protein
MHLAWIEGSNDGNDTFGLICGYALVLLLLFVAAVMGGQHE